MDNENLRTNSDKLNHLVIKVDEIWEVIYKRDNSDPPLREQIHRNTEHRKKEESKNKFLHNLFVQTILSIIGGITIAYIVFHYVGVK